MLASLIAALGSCTASVDAGIPNPAECEVDSATVRDPAACEAVTMGGADTGAHPVDEWATWILDGTPEVDAGTGYRTTVGDLDGDGLDDIVTTGNRSPEPNVYVVLGSTLNALGPGRYPIAEVATSVITVHEMSSKYGPYYDAAALHIDHGDVYIGNPTHPDQPLAYLVRWATLKAAGSESTHALEDVADVRFEWGPDSHGSDEVGESIQVCDVNGDGHRDLLLARAFDGNTGYAGSPGYLALGPFSSATFDLETEGARIYSSHEPVPPYSADGEWGARGLGACRDYNGDGVDDISMSSVDPLAPDQNILGVYYGSPTLGASGVLDLAYSDVLIKFTPDPTASWEYAFTTPEGAADWDGDGNIDLLVHRWASFWEDDASRMESELLLFRGGCGFYASGTVLTESDRYLSVADPDGGYLAWDASMAGDSNGDGFPELVLGRPANAQYDAGSLLVRTCPLAGGDYSIADFADATYAGEEGDFGSAVIASGDIDGNGLTDLIVGSGSVRWSGGMGAGPGAVYVARH